MSIWNKVLVGLIIPAALFFFYTAARALKTQECWGKKTIDFGRALEEKQKENLDLHDGDEDGMTKKDGTMSVRRSQAELHRLLINRGRIWEQCQPQRVDQRSGQAAIHIDSSAPVHISDKMVLYVFEEGEGQKGGQYLGEFKVTDVDAAENKVGLAPTMKPTERELKRLAASKGPWVLYELMPVDRHDLLADAPPEEKKGLLPQESIAEYLKDGQPAEAADPADRKDSGKYKRLLRDYQALFRLCHVDRTLFVDTYESVSRDEQYLQAALTDARSHLQYVQQEVDALKADFAVATKEQNAVIRHRSVLAQQVEAIRQIVADRIKENLVLAAEIAKVQWDVARRIDERTHTMARASTGAN